MDAAEKDANNDGSEWRPLIGEEGAYPPVACILGKTNQFTEDRVGELVAWVSNTLAIEHVIPMRTFQVLTRQARRNYLVSDVRKEFNKDWKLTSLHALEALEAMRPAPSRGYSTTRRLNRHAASALGSLAI